MPARKSTPKAEALIGALAKLDPAELAELRAALGAETPAEEPAKPARKRAATARRSSSSRAADASPATRRAHKRAAGNGGKVSGPSEMRRVLEEHGAPMSSRELTRIVIDADKARTPSTRIFAAATPAATLTAKLAVSHNADGPFVRTHPGIYALRAWSVSKLTKKPIMPAGEDAPAALKRDAAKALLAGTPEPAAAPAPAPARKRAAKKPAAKKPAPAATPEPAPEPAKKPSSSTPRRANGTIAPSPKPAAKKPAAKPKAAATPRVREAAVARVSTPEPAKASSKPAAKKPATSRLRSAAKPKPAAPAADAPSAAERLSEVGLEFTRGTRR